MKKEALRKVLSLLVAFSLIFQQAGFAQGLAQLDISRYLGAFSGPEQFRPLQLRYFSYNPLTDNFQILLDKGTLKKVEDSQVKEQGQELLKYFLVGVALPDENFWVNLRPDSEDEVISRELARTDVGKVLLEADLQLKKDVARFTSPETTEGREYWNKLYQKAGQLFNSSEITIPTLTRPWIVPGEVIIRENETSAYVYKGTLKVMLEQDHLKNSPDYNFADPRLKELNEYSSQIIRETIIPKLTKEVNSSKRYATLRQVFFSLILSRWFKHKFAGTVPVRAKNYASQEGLSQTVSTAPAYINLINSGDLTNLTSKEPWSKTTYFEEYKKSFAQGEYNLKEQVYVPTSAAGGSAFGGGPVIRSYFSGGVTFAGELGMPQAASPVTTPVGSLQGKNLNVDAALKNGKDMVPAAGDASNGILPELTTNATEVTAAKASRPSAASPITSTMPAIYYFGKFLSGDGSLPKGGAKDRATLGGKGANLAAMANYLAKKFEELEESIKRGFKLNVPPGFTVTTTQTAQWRERLGAITEEQRKSMSLLELARATLGQKLIDELIASLKLLQETMGKDLGDEENDPLLIAVRSGAAESMAGMMDTILNLGLNDKSVLALAKARNGDYRFAFDTYRRFIEMFGHTVLGVEENEKARQGFKYILQDLIKETGRKEDELRAEDLKVLVERYKKEIQRQGIKDSIPDDPIDQYLMAVYTVMKSSFSKRSMIVRKKEGFKLEDTLSAVNVLPMIYGNRNKLSGSGVAFSRDLRDGKRVHNLEFNFNCQGEDVVSGRKKGLSLDELRKANPQLAANLEAILDFLEKEYKDVQDVEFTFEHDPETGETKLWILQARNAKRTAMAEVRTAVEMVAEGLISIKQAIKRITPAKMVELFVNQFDKDDKKKALEDGRLLSDGGLDASPGAGTGVLVFDSGRAEEISARIVSIKERLKNGEVVSDNERYLGTTDLATVDGVILCREETEPADINGMLVALAFWTKRGGRTSHAAVVARQMGKPAVVGDENIEPDFKTGTLTVKKSDGSHVVLHEGDIISVDGTGDNSKGQVFAGKIETIPSSVAVALYKESLGKVRRVVDLLKVWKDSASGNILSEYEKNISDLEKHIAKYSSIELTEQEKAFYAQYKQFIQWVEEAKGKPVAANAEKPLDVEYANLVGANNFGLVRTEHRFSGDGRDLLFQRFILADILDNPQQAREEVLREIIQIQQVDNELLFMFADGKPVTIRFMDPPLHEFVPKSVEKIIELALAFMLGKERLESALKTANKLLQDAKDRNEVLEEKEKIELFARAAGLSVDDLSVMFNKVKAGIEALREENPMFGTRGCRLSALFPEIQKMESEAIFNALNKVKQAGIEVNVELMVPLVGNAKEFTIAKEVVEKAAKEEGIDRKSFKIGTMIEIGAGVMNIRELLEAGIEFISFGTNDLTQGVLTISRDDAKEWLRIAQLIGVFDDDPSVTISPEVALFIKRVMDEIQAYNKEHGSKVKAGICGEQGLDAKSIIRYLAPYGLDYFSGSPRGIPGARVASAQAKLKMDEEAALKREQPVREEPRPEVAREEGAGPKFRIMEVTTGTDRPIETTSTIGMIKIEPAFFDQDIRYKIQKFLLSDKFIIISSVEGVKEVAEYMAFFIKRFSEHIGKIAKAGETVSIRLPDLALGTIFEYGSEEEREAVIARLSNDLKMTELEVRTGIAKYHEANPAIGTRGMRAFVLPRISTLYNAIAVAAASVAKEKGNQNVDIILPFLTNGWELEAILNGFKTDNGETIVSSLRETLDKVEGVKARFGAVIESPAAVATARDIAEHADFLVIDVKKLTEATWSAFEKDTRAGFFKVYMEKGIWEKDPFIYALKEVRQLIQEAITAARGIKKDLEIRVVTNSKDDDLISLAKDSGVNSLIVPPEDVILALTKAASSPVTQSVDKLENIIATLEAVIANIYEGKEVGSEKVARLLKLAYELKGGAKGFSLGITPFRPGTILFSEGSVYFVKAEYTKQVDPRYHSHGHVFDGWYWNPEKGLFTFREYPVHGGIPVYSSTTTLTVNDIKALLFEQLSSLSLENLSLRERLRWYTLWLEVGSADKDPQFDEKMGAWLRQNREFLLLIADQHGNKPVKRNTLIFDKESGSVTFVKNVIDNSVFGKKFQNGSWKDVLREPVPSGGMVTLETLQKLIVALDKEQQASSPVETVTFDELEPKLLQMIEQIRVYAFKHYADERMRSFWVNINGSWMEFNTTEYSGVQGGIRAKNRVFLRIKELVRGKERSFRYELVNGNILPIGSGLGNQLFIRTIELSQVVSSLMNRFETTAAAGAGAAASSPLNSSDFIRRISTEATKVRLATVEFRTGESAGRILSAIRELNNNRERNRERDFYSLERGMIYFPSDSSRPANVDSYEEALVQRAIIELGVDNLTIPKIKANTDLSENGVRFALSEISKSRNYLVGYNISDDGRISTYDKTSGRASSAVVADTAFQEIISQIPESLLEKRPYLKRIIGDTTITPIEKINNIFEFFRAILQSWVEWDYKTKQWVDKRSHEWDYDSKTWGGKAEFTPGEIGKIQALVYKVIPQIKENIDTKKTDVFASSPVSALQGVVDEILRDTNSGQLSLTVNQREVIVNALPEERSKVIREIESRIISNITVSFVYKGDNFEDLISQVPLDVIYKPFIKRALSLRRTILRDAAQPKTASPLAQTQLKSSSPPMIAPETTDVGGIDFRAIPMITKPMGNLSGLNFSLPHLSNLENINLDEELGQIQRMLEAGIIPSGERLKEYVAACYQKGELKEHLDGIVASLVDTCKLEEEKADVTSNALKEVMLILDSIS